ncbi:EPIDERMAL PATTERNING FACTOR-like protein 6 [Salvia splendens]|uniref:EPIDERMAL PATTERNING FACTOR-like protein 6 n=1 Tax=Salvia splendens TaxID=180675 RepID=UPI001C2690AD|nr:EPIDERMAL PATTERNING FACTOR-like protein 6 [Salvia splendens]
MEICLNIFGRRRRSRRRNAIKEWRFPIALTILFFFLCFCAPFISCQNPQILPESMSLMTIGADVISYKGLESYKIGGARRLLSGPGSSPPRCSSKCGSCTPCTPVHVPVPPGTPVTTEYYPEAWRCKCRNKFYIP